jgi:ArsR family transcriptional regulator
MKQAWFQAEAQILKALAHPKRLEIVHLLHGRVLTASQIQHMTGLPQANVSQHLRLLKVARVIVAVRHGQSISFRLAHPNFSQLSRVLESTRQQNPTDRQHNKTWRVQDTVCGMWVEPVTARWQTVYKGATYFFCASGCHQRFEKNPEKYV